MAYKLTINERLVCCINNKNSSEKQTLNIQLDQSVILTFKRFMKCQKLYFLLRNFAHLSLFGKVSEQ